MTVTIETTGIKAFETFIERLPDAATQAARIAINDVAKGEGRKALVRRMYEQVNFPAGYIDENRLALKQQATDNNLEAVIVGRQRPTSLARFASGAAIGQRVPSIAVRVKRTGGSASLPGAFLVRLRAGRQLSEDRFNVGLAIRVKPGSGVIGRRTQREPIFPNVYLLYAPSVDQVFRTVADEESGTLSQMVATEFFRQFDRLVASA